MKHPGFNPKARWDRRIPTEENNQPDDALNERIDVLLWSKGGMLYPQLFIWNNKSYPIKEITYRWQEHRGAECISYFSVSTGANLYQISFNNTTLGWRINKIIS